MTREQKELKLNEFISNIFLDVVRLTYILKDLKIKNADLLSKDIEKVRKDLSDIRNASNELTEEQKQDKELLRQYAIQINEYQTDIDLHAQVTELIEKNELALADSIKLYTEMNNNTEHYINLI